MTLGVGIRCFTDGWRIVRREGLLRYVWLPASVSLAIIAGGLYLVFGYVDATSRWLTDLLPDWLDFLDAVLTPLLYLVGILLGAWLFGFLAIVVASPFMGNLARHVERTQGLPEGNEEIGTLTSVGRTLAREARKLGYQLPRLAVAFVLTLLPVVNLLSPLIWLFFGAWMMAVQFGDFASENRGEPFAATLERLRGGRSAALGFGACTAIALAIPLVNFIVVPVAVAGGTLLWHRVGGGGDRQ